MSRAEMADYQAKLAAREQVQLEWTLVCLAYNFRRLFRLGGAALLEAAAPN